MISRVLFVGDPYRGEQAGNIEKIKLLFSLVLKQFGVLVEAYISDINRNIGRDQWVPTWKKSLSCYPGPALAEMYLEGSAIIGFEVPEVELEFLSRKNIPWINFCIHPLRFLDDLCFEVTSSFLFDMKGMEVSPGLIEVCVNKFKNYNTCRDDLSPQKTLLICGQDWIDRSIFFDDQFRRLDDYLPQLDSLVRNFDRVLYKPHPAHSSQKVSELMVVRYGAQNCAGSNIYDLFANQGVDTVCAISSSVLAEAPFFDVKSVFLEPRAKRYGPAISYKSLIDNSEFWEEGFLRREGVKKKSLSISQGVPSNYLRRIFGSWGFVTDEVRLENRISQLESRVIAAEVSTQEQARRAVAAGVEIRAHEQRAAVAEALALKCERFAEQADARAHALERRTAQAEARASELEQLVAQAEALALELVQRAERAEALRLHEEQQLEMAQTKVKQVEVDLAAARAELHDVHQSNHLHWQLAETRQQNLVAVYSSWSWRVTAPLRWGGGMVLHPVTTVRTSANWLIYNSIQTFQRPLSRLMAVVLRRPQLSCRINQVLLRYPALYQQLLGVAHRAGVVAGAQPMHSAHTPPTTESVTPELINLTPRARQIYADLQKAIKNSRRPD